MRPLNNQIAGETSRENDNKALSDSAWLRGMKWLFRSIPPRYLTASSVSQPTSGRVTPEWQLSREHKEWEPYGYVGTPAADMPDQVSRAVKEKRNQRLLEAVNIHGAQRHLKFVGRQVQVLVEGPSKKNPTRLKSRTRRNKIVVFDGSPQHCGRLLE